MTVKIEVLLGTDTLIRNFIEDTLMIEDEQTLYSSEIWEMLMNNEHFKQAEVVSCFEQNELVGFIPITKIDSEKYYFLNEDIKVATFFEFFGFEDVYLPFALQYLREKFPDVLLDWDVNPWMKEAGYVISEIEEENERLCLFGLQPYVLSGKEFDIIHAFKDYHARGEVRSITARVCSDSELSSETWGENGVEKLGSYQINPLNSVTSFYGFKYFKPDLLNPYSYRNPLNVHYIVAYSHELKRGKELKRIVGIIALSDEKDSYCLAFINVHREYRRMGIAKLLYQTLNDFLSPNDILISSGLSDEGKEAKLNEVRSSLVTKCKVYESRDDFLAATCKNVVLVK